MNEEKTNEIPTNEVTKNDNKKLKTILLIAIFIIAISGITIAVYQLKSEDKKADVNEPNTQETTNNESDNNEDYQLDDETTEKIDKYLKNIKMEVTEEDKIRLINSSNSDGGMSERFVGEMFKEEISNEYKLLYTLSLIGDEIIAENDEEAFGKKSISRNNLLKYAHLYFKDVEIPESIEPELAYLNAYNLKCEKEYCTFDLIPHGLEGPIGYYVTKETKKDNKIQLQYMFIEFDAVGEDDDNLKYLEKIYDQKNGTLKKEIEIGEGWSEELEDDELFNQYTPPASVEYTFDENNALISVKRLDK